MRLRGVDDQQGEQFVCLTQFMEGTDVFFRDNQKVHGCLRADIVKGNHLVIFIKLARRYFTSDDLAKQTVHGQSPGWYLKRPEFSGQGAWVKNDIHDLGLVLDSKTKLVLIESWDEPRVLETLTSLAVRRS